MMLIKSILNIIIIFNVHYSDISKFSKMQILPGIDLYIVKLLM